MRGSRERLLFLTADWTVSSLVFTPWGRSCDAQGYRWSGEVLVLEEGHTCTKLPPAVMDGGQHSD
jgi:hypothetical protein